MVESLNLSVFVGVALSEATRQRRARFLELRAEQGGVGQRGGVWGTEYGLSGEEREEAERELLGEEKEEYEYDPCAGSNLKLEW